MNNKNKDNLILYELKKIHEALQKRNTSKFRMLNSTEKFYFSELILNTRKLDSIRLSVYNSVFNLNWWIIQIFYDTQGEAWPGLYFSCYTVIIAFILAAWVNRNSRIN